MTQEQLRMQMLAGIITESQYKETLEEGKENFIENLKKVFNDISQNKIFVGKDPENEREDAIFYDDKDPFYSIPEGDKIYCLTRIPRMSPFPYPISKYPDVTPLNPDNLRIIYRILSSSVYGIKMGCPDIINEDGGYILVQFKEGQGYINRKGKGKRLRQGPKYDLGMGLEFTLL